MIVTREINLKNIKMKNIFKSLICLFALALLATSCDEDETTYIPLDYPNDAFVAFEESIISVPEGSPTDIIVEVFLATINQNDNVTVDFEISSSNAILGTHYEIVDNKSQFSIESGKYSDDIRIRLIDNTDTDGNKELTITLTSNSSGANIGYLGPDALGSSFVLKIIDDDCPVELVGEYNEISETQPFNVPGLTTIDKIEAGANANEYWIYGVYSELYSVYWGEVFQSGFGNEGLVQMIDNGDGTVSIPCQYLGQTLPGPYDYWISGTGNYSSCDKTLNLSFGLQFDDTCTDNYGATTLLLELK